MRNMRNMYIIYHETQIHIHKGYSSKGMTYFRKDMFYNIIQNGLQARGKR